MNIHPVQKLNVKTIINPRYNTPYSRFMVTSGPPMRWLETRCRKLYQLILEYEGIEKVHISEHEVFENMNTDRRQRLVIIFSR